MARPIHAASRLRLLIAGSFLAFLGALLTCRHETVLVDPASDSTGTGGGGGGGTVQRATLTVTIGVSGDDSAFAAALGSPNGVLAGAEVIIERVGTTGSRQFDTTEADGQVRFERLLGGTYSVRAVRLLSASETALLGPGAEDVNAFGGGSNLAVSAPSTDTTITIHAGRRGSLVISEVYAYSPRGVGGPSLNYFFGHFIELYNNSDTTIYLDGKVIARDMDGLMRDGDRFPCTIGEEWRNDPDGIWSQHLYAFPGTGRDYPLAPGQAVVVATDAIDHGAIQSGLPDLSGARFEFIGSADVDNPSAVNMLNVGIREFISTLGHGLYFAGWADMVVVLADSMDVSTLPEDDVPVFTEPRHVRIPREKILDVFMTTPTPAVESAYTYPLCPQGTNLYFEGQPANLRDLESPNTYRRRLLVVLASGRAVLMRTKTSANDFEGVVPATPGQVP
jgi:hypothetical protein